MQVRKEKEISIVIRFTTLFIGFQVSSDQITMFIKNHNGEPGIQHMALTCTENIKNAVRMAKVHGAEFLTPCLDYYSQVSSY